MLHHFTTSLFVTASSIVPLFFNNKDSPFTYGFLLPVVHGFAICQVSRALRQSCTAPERARVWVALVAIRRILRVF